MKHDNLFKTLYYSNECADDDSMFLSPEYRLWADKFEKWLSTSDIKFANRYKRQDDETSVLFYDGQENIWFSDTLEVCPWIKTVIQYYVHSKNLKSGERFEYKP